MTELEYKILIYIKEKNEIHWIDLLNDLHPEFSYQDTGAVAQMLLDNGLLENPAPVNPPPLCQLRLSDRGRITLLSEEDRLRREESLRQDNIHKEQAQEQKELDRIIRERADCEADRAAEHRFQTRLSLWNTILSAALGAFFTNLDRIVPFLIQFFK